MSWLSKWGKKAERFISNAIPHQHSADRRAAMQAANEQIQYYKDLKNEAAQQKKEFEREKKEEQRKLAEKQARSLRRRKRSPGFLQDEPKQELSERLG